MQKIIDFITDGATVTIKEISKTNDVHFVYRNSPCVDARIRASNKHFGERF